MIERIHLQILHEVDKRGTLTGAAEGLCLTQPALTHAIKKLEHQLDTPLWIKEGRRLRLTQAGRYLLDLADRLLPQFEHAEEVMQQFSEGKRGVLRIGMECHPCYRWLLRVVAPFLERWPDVDVDVKQEFQFNGIAALIGYDIDLLITPDPLFTANLNFIPVFDYELVLTVSSQHPLAKREELKPEDLIDEQVITYPVALERLDLFTQFLLPAHCSPRKIKVIETTDIMLQLVASGRGVTALPSWLVAEYAEKFSLRTLRIGSGGIKKQICIGVRKRDAGLEYIRGFIQLAKNRTLSAV